MHERNPQSHRAGDAGAPASERAQRAADRIDKKRASASASPPTMEDYELKEYLAGKLREAGHEVIDFGDRTAEPG